jgi:uncharacterized protein (TIGR00297 family)
MEFLTLNLKGVVLAVVFGLAFLYFGLGLGPFFLIGMIVFLALSSAVTHVGITRKRGLGIEQDPRGVWNVLANGLPPLIMVVLFYFALLWGSEGLALLSIIGFLSSLAAIMADKFGSEIGVLDGKPKMIFTLDEVKKGTSGGITELGLFAGIGAAFIISLLLLLIPGHITALSGYYGFSLEKAVLIITVSGFAGSIIDSILGYYEERGIGNKFTSNFACGIAAGLIGMLLFIIL